jgi:hypothetical protein
MGWGKSIAFVLRVHCYEAAIRMAHAGFAAVSLDFKYGIIGSIILS